ncbi:MAG: hypothetical protein HYV04_17170 [Deltaproteobacteria bacterium]|nr:hypothetical protein [Deltaproteobacteria bacterium]
MRQLIEQLNREYGFQLSEEEIDLIARQAEATRRLFEPLYQVDLSGVMPMLRFDRKSKK